MQWLQLTFDLPLTPVDDSDDHDQVSSPLRKQAASDLNSTDEGDQAPSSGSNPTDSNRSKTRSRPQTSAGVDVHQDEDQEDSSDLDCDEDDDEDDEEDLSFESEQLSSSRDHDHDPRFNQSYTTALNDTLESTTDDESLDSQADTDHDDDHHHHQDHSRRSKGRETRESTHQLSLTDLESRSSSSKPPSKPKKSVVDDDFFSLAAFESEAESGEAEMRRKLRRSMGESGEPEDDSNGSEEEDIDLFSRHSTGLLDDEEGEEGGDGRQAFDLDSVADLRYNDFFAPIAGKPSSKSLTKSKDQVIQQTQKKRKNSDPQVKSKVSRVKFSEEVIVKEIPAKNRGVRVAQIDDDESDEEDDYDSGEDEDDDEDDDEEGSDSSESTDDDEGNLSNLSESNLGDDQAIDQDDDDYEEGGESTMNRLSQDLFDDHDEQVLEGSSDSEASGASSHEGSTNLSRHARKMKILSKQIAQLEEQNVKKKEWVLKGEATAKDRPQNSLLEQDLEFEHIQKIAPAVTEEKTLGLEALIKQRILERNYDDVIRKRLVDPKAFLPSRLIELEDTKAEKSLAELYEDEYKASKSKLETGLKAIDRKDDKLNKQHDDIKDLFESLCGKLDALSNAHFTPQQPKPTIKTINDLPAISMESNLPTATGSGTLLAPEEIYKVQSTKEIMLDPNELTHSQKQNLRTQAKRKRSKQRSNSIHPRSDSNQGDPDGRGGRQGIDRLNVKDQKALSLDKLKKDYGNSSNLTILNPTQLPRHRSSHSAQAGPTTTPVDHHHKKSRRLSDGKSFKL